MRKNERIIVKIASITQNFLHYHKIIFGDMRIKDCNFLEEQKLNTYFNTLKRLNLSTTIEMKIFLKN